MGSDFKKRLFVSFGIILGAALVSGVALYFLAGWMDATVTKVIADRALIDARSGSVAVYSSLKRQAAQAVVYQNAMEQLVPTQDQLLFFHKWIADIGNKYNVVAEASLQGGVGAPSGSVGQAIGFTVTATGGLNNLVAFLDDIQTKSPGYLLQLTSFNLTKQGDNYGVNGQGQLFFR